MFAARIRSVISSVVMLSVAAASFLCMPHSEVLAGSSFESAGEATQNIIAGWNLGNSLDSYSRSISSSSGTSAYETAWGNPVTTQAMIDSVKAQGFNAVRIPVTWSQHIDSSGNVNTKWMNRVKTVVNYCYNSGLYVILNVHHDTGVKGGDKVSWIFADSTTYNNTKTKFAGLWRNIANEFKDYGERLLFEGYNEMMDTNSNWNEPSNSSSYKPLNDYAQLFVDTVRATGGNNAQRNLIVNNYVASIYASTLNNFKVPTDSATGHLICEVHCYDPWAFTGDSKTVTWTSVHNDFRSSDKTEIDTIMKRLKSFSDSKGIPVIIGEFGAMYKSNDSAIASYASYFVDAAGKRGIKCFIWDNGKYNVSSEYSIFDRKNLKWKTGISSAIINAAWPYANHSGDDPTPPEPALNNGWNQIGSYWYYVESGSNVTNAWRKISKKWYRFDSKGRMVTGLVSIDGTNYFFDGSGALATGWKEANGKWYYFTSNGARTGWYQSSKKWYYLDPAKGGAMAVGFYSVSGVYYFFSTSGALATGWKEANGKWYYFTTNGAKTGWYKSGKKWYYLDPAKGGVMVTGTKTIDGVTYKFDSSGVWIK